MSKYNHCIRPTRIQIAPAISLEVECVVLPRKGFIDVVLYLLSFLHNTMVYCLKVAEVIVVHLKIFDSTEMSGTWPTPNTTDK